MRRHTAIYPFLLLVLALSFELIISPLGQRAYVKAKTLDETPTPGITSCGVPITQETCAWYNANYVFYSADTEEIPNCWGFFCFGTKEVTVIHEHPLPGLFCIPCGSNGGGHGDTGAENGDSSVLFSSSEETADGTSVGHLEIDETPGVGKPLTEDEKQTAQFLVEHIYNNPNEDLVLKNVDNQPRDGTGNTADLTRTNAILNVNHKIEIYSPETDSVRNIISTVVDKNDQVGPNGELAINLKNTRLRAKDLGNVMARLIGALLKKEGGQIHITRIIIIQNADPAALPLVAKPWFVIQDFHQLLVPELLPKKA